LRAAFDVPSPLQRQVRKGKPRRVAGMDAGQFGVRAGCPVDKPRSPDANLTGRRPVRRGSGVAFLLVTSLYSGHPALRPSGRLRRSRPFQTGAWPHKEK
jgi:hypothetical protein